MLVLSRKNGQKIIINDNIEITILESKFDNCKISISAPMDVKIYREEVYKQIKATNEMSKSASVASLNLLKDLSIKQDNSIVSKLNEVIVRKK
jgi:carbon storage regulator